MAEENKAAHTPGPWHVAAERGCKDIRAKLPGKRYGLTIAGTVGLSDEKIDRANARLIAAAPDMLAELKTSLCPGGGYTGQPDSEDRTVENCLKAGVCGCSCGAVVAKATGA